MDDGQFFALLGVAWIFGLLVLTVAGWHLRSKRQIEKAKIIHAERMRAIEKGIPLPEFPELPDDPTGRHRARPVNPRWPLGAGALLITGGIGVSVALALGGRDFEGLWSFGLVPVFLGVGMFLFYSLTRRPSAD